MKAHIEKFYKTALDPVKVKAVIKKLQEKNLTRQEIFQIINQRPQKAVELFIVLLHSAR